VRNIPISELTNFCEFVVVDHVTMQKEEEELERAKRERKRRKARRAAAVKIIGDLDAMEAFEIVPAALELGRAQANGDGNAITCARRNGTDTQQVVFTEAEDGYVNVVTWSASTSVFTALKGGGEFTKVIQAPLLQVGEESFAAAGGSESISFNPLGQMWEIVVFEDGAFGLSPAAHPGMYVEAALDQPEGEQVLRLIPESEASNFSSFRLVKPSSAPNTATPEAGDKNKKGKKDKGPQEDPMVVARRSDIAKAMARDDWAGMKIQLTSGSDRDAFVAVDPQSSDYAVVFAKPERAKAATFTVVDAGQGYIALAVDDGEAGTYWAPREGGKGCIAAAAEAPYDAAIEVVLLEGAEGFCLAPLAHPGKVMEVQFNDPVPHPITLVAEEDISTFSEFIRVDVAPPPSAA